MQSAFEPGRGQQRHVHLHLKRQKKTVMPSASIFCLKVQSVQQTAWFGQRCLFPPGFLTRVAEYLVVNGASFVSCDLLQVCCFHRWFSKVIHLRHRFQRTTVSRWHILFNSSESRFFAFGSLKGPVARLLRWRPLWEGQCGVGKKLTSLPPRPDRPIARQALGSGMGG